jgi:hypothetical protein
VVIENSRGNISIAQDNGSGLHFFIATGNYISFLTSNFR